MLIYHRRIFLFICENYNFEMNKKIEVISSKIVSDVCDVVMCERCG